MSEYKVPLRDLQFVRDEVLDFYALWQTLPGYEDATEDIVKAILREEAKFCENELAPLNQRGDEEGCTWHEDGSVTTPRGFKEAYQAYIEGGWPMLSVPVEYGGQGLPDSLSIVFNEMKGSANWSWNMYPGLSKSAMHLLQEHGSEEQKQTYLLPLVEGTWTGTMCLTESHCGTDLGLLRTTAEPQHDDTYKITGTKIFISAGEHDMAENIIHLVLARLPDAPDGTRGISIFIVPKVLSDGSRNAVSCGSLEHKMGIHGNATCVMNFDGASGYLIGEPNRGLKYMFTMMNNARIGTAIQGLTHAEVALQLATSYARERLQMRSLTGPKNPDGAADPIIVHPDVRRMLLTCKAFAEGGRLMINYLSQYADILARSNKKVAVREADELLSLLTPIAKAFLTETGFECANLGMQVLGGHGYIREWGAEQNVRDSRISMLYEGTTGIQALDLIGRKVLGSGGELLNRFTDVITEFCRDNSGDGPIGEFVEILTGLVTEWGEVTADIGARAMKNPDEVGGVSVDYLMYSGYVSLAFFWALAARTAAHKLEAGTDEQNFYKTKLQTATFYYERILPRAHTHRLNMKSPVSTLMDVDESCFVSGGK
jgi:alkylation response protein AidB-like acyl-CoA dehydrogenase